MILIMAVVVEEEVERDNVECVWDAWLVQMMMFMFFLKKSCVET